jgi:hypothetical protein
MATLAVCAARAQPQYDLTAVLRSDIPLAGEPRLYAVSSVPAAISRDGQVAFVGDGMLMLASPNGHVVVAAPGDALPDGQTIFDIAGISANAQGDVVMVATYRGPQVRFEIPPSAVMRYSAGSWTTVAKAGDAAPGGGTFSGFQLPAINARGQVAFAAQVGSAEILYLDDHGTIQEIAPATTTPVGGPGFRFSSVQLNDAGQLAVETACCLDPGVVGLTPRGVFMADHGTVTPLGFPGMAAPDGGTVSVASHPAINDRGTVAFAAFLQSGQSVIYSYSGGAVSTIVKAGDVVATTTAGDLTLSSVGAPTIDESGRIAFRGSFQAMPQAIATGVFVADGTVRPAALSGEPVVGGGLLTGATDPLFNGAGDLIFRDAVSPGLSRLYRATADGPVLVAGNGDAVTGTPLRLTAIPSPGVMVPVQGPAALASISPGQMGVFDANGTLRVRLGDELTDGDPIVAIRRVSSSPAGIIALDVTLATGESAIVLSHDGELTEVVRSGQPAPDGDSFSGVRGASVNDAGQVAFASGTAGFGGVYLADGGTITTVARGSDLVVDGDQLNFGSGTAVTSQGVVAFDVRHDDPFQGAIFVASAGGLTIAMKSTDAAPDGKIFGWPTAFDVNNAGQVAFNAASSSLYLSTPGEGIQALGTGAPGSLLDDGTVLLSDATTIVPGNPPEAVIHPGDAVPGGGTFSSFRQAAITAGGQIFFLAAWPTDTSGEAPVAAGTGMFLLSPHTESREVGIAIRPAGDANRINPVSSARIPVAILSDETFDAATVLADTVRFGITGTEASVVRDRMKDVDGNGYPDLVLRFRIQDTGVVCGDTTLRLTGRTADGTQITGSDRIRTVRCR